MAHVPHAGAVESTYSAWLDFTANADGHAPRLRTGRARYVVRMSEIRIAGRVAVGRDAEPPTPRRAVHDLSAL